MTGADQHIAGAALPVAIGLLVLALVARVALWAPADDPRLRALAREYLPALTTWCVAAAGVYAVALAGTGDAGAMSFVAPVVIAAAAVLARTLETEADGGGRTAAPAATVAGRGRSLASAPNGSVAGRDRGAAPAAAEEGRECAAIGAPVPTRRGSLWAEPGGDGPDDARTGLWSR